MSATVPYEDMRFPVTQPLTTFLWEVRGPDRVEARGECPRCRCVTVKVWQEVQYVTKGPSKPLRGLFDDGEPRLAMCECETWHVNRPAQVPDGCGASFWLAPPPQGLSL
ncbi:hypothetical protein [Streptomyces sp. NPDC055632]